MQIKYNSNGNYFDIFGQDGNSLYRGTGMPDVWLSKNGFGSSANFLSMGEDDFRKWLNANASMKINAGQDAWNNYRHQLLPGI